MLILVFENDHGLIARKATAWERLRARTWAGPVDRQLASGTAPEASALHALRAFALVRREERESLAHALRRILDDAAQPTSRGGSRVVPPRRSILGAADVLAVLIDRLRSPEPVSACGVAKVKVLVHDGAGPLYYPAAGDSLCRCVEDAIHALDSQLTW